MEENIKKAIAILLLGCFVVSLTVTSATAKTYKQGMGEKKDNNPISVDDHNVIMKYQGILNALGYLDSYSVNGYYGPETTKAVKKFQRAHGIQDTGNIGGKTDRALKEEYAIFKHPIQTIKHPIKAVKKTVAWYNNDAAFNEGTKRMETIKKSLPFNVNINLNKNL